MSTVLDLTEKFEVSEFGGKAANLSSMLQAGLPVPGGLAVSIGAFNQQGNLTTEAKQKIENLLDKDKLYAIRSSALAEDAEDASWAGQFETFLNMPAKDVINKVEECHNSAKARAKAYAEEQTASDSFNIAVVVQEMIQPKYAGVLFTKDPLTGKDKLITEYVEGLGEDLVSGKADPKSISWSAGDKSEAPFNIDELTNLAKKVEEIFDSPQDIEWAATEDKVWLVQARPITVVQKDINEGHSLGKPEELFYWGPSRTNPVYMSDWLAATEQVYVEMSKDKNLPVPPKALVLFYKGKMVFLSNAKLFQEWCEKSFEVYKSRNQLEEDVNKWQKLAKILPSLQGTDFSKAIVEAWTYTILPEFSLYGAESNIAKHLSRFDAKTRQKIWGAFTVPDKPTFLSRIDIELANCQDPIVMAEKYPWIQDGYEGLSGNAKKYFEERLRLIGDEIQAVRDLESERNELKEELSLTVQEVESLTLARKLAEFMDDRKAWMMQTRRLIKSSLTNVEFGWIFEDGKVDNINERHTEDLWQRYVDFKSSSSAVKGIVASNGGRHFINGEVAVISSPTDAVGSNKILAVPSTSPSYVPLMRNAKALITDHGGMMSHAAIVAREFNLPCIVGTKQGTKTLKTGDKVILDLVKGEVNKKIDYS